MNPLIDQNGIPKVGGRLQNLMLPTKLGKHLIIIAKGYLANLMVTYYHNKVYHERRNMTVAAVRTAGYWILSLQQIASSLINHCH